MYSGENVLVIAPDSEVVSVLTAALYDSDPDKALPLHAQFNYANGEYRQLSPYVMTTDKKVPMKSITHTHSLAHARTHSITYLLTHSFIHSLTH